MVRDLRARIRTKMSYVGALSSSIIDMAKMLIKISSLRKPSILKNAERIKLVLPEAKKSVLIMYYQTALNSTSWKRYSWP